MPTQTLEAIDERIRALRKEIRELYLEGDRIREEQAVCPHVSRVPGWVRGFVCTGCGQRIG